MRARFAKATRITAIMLGIVALAASCKKAADSPTADSTFVHAMVDLRVLATNTALDSGAQARARDSILHRYGTSAADLEATARQIAKNPDHAVELLRKIDNGARTAPKPAFVPPPTAVGGPPK
jgi:hypothetical protein